MINKKILLWGLLGIFLLGAFIGSGTPGRKASAQGTDNTWSTPVNLSNSGSTTNPAMVVDSDGVIHVIWVDEFAGYMYTQFDGNEWSQPTAVSFPFGQTTTTAGATTDLPIPILIADNQGYVHAFWTDQENTLYYSRVQASRFGEAGAWEARQALAESALDMSVAIDSQNNIHLGYIRDLDSEAFPAGVYYRRSTDGGANWSPGVPLYESLYFRSLNPSDAHIQIAVTDGPESSFVYVVWDDRSVKRVLLTMSNDGGDTWGTASEIDGPKADTVTTTPFEIMIHPEGEDILLIWKAGLQSGFDCTQYYQFSDDQGKTWSDRKIMLDNLVGCPQEEKLFQTANGIVLLQTTIQDEVYLLAWNGNNWSDPQPQSNLSSFTDTQTYNSLDFQCRQPILSGKDRLFEVGCDTVGSGDIWFTSRSIGSVNDWFPPPSAWSIPSIVSDGDNLVISSPVAVSDELGLIHIFWSQLENTSVKQDKTIQYTRLNKDSWLQPVSILRASGADHPVVALDSKGRILLAYNTGGFGDLYFSWAEAEKANNVFEWAKPQLLPSLHPSNNSSPDMLITKNGEIFLAYAIAVNEDRGIYLIHSTDGGTTWSQPIQVFDGVAAMWEMVDRPKLGRTLNGNLYLLWEHGTLSNTERASGLYFAQSEDGGQTWSNPETVTEQLITWSDIVGVGESTIHRFWKSLDSNGNINLWHEVSLDGGQNWSSMENLTSLGEALGPVSVIADQGGQIHLVMASKEFSEKWVLRYKVWDGERWSSEEDIKLDIPSTENITSLSATLTGEDKLAVVYVVQTLDSEGVKADHLYYTSRMVQLPAEASTTDGLNTTLTPTPELSPTPLEVNTPVPTTSITNTPTPVVDLSGLDDRRPQTQIPFLNNSLGGPVLGGGVALLVIGITFGIIWIKQKGRR